MKAIYPAKMPDELIEIINESNFLDIYGHVCVAEKQSAGYYASVISNYRTEITSMLENISYELKEMFGYDKDGYELDDFSCTIGNGQISTYFVVELSGVSFEIRISDHADKHFYGNRMQVSLLSKTAKEDFYDAIINGVKKLEYEKVQI